MEGEIVENSNELTKLHKYVFMTEDIFFVNGIQCLILLSHNITLTVVSHIEERKYATTFKAFNGISMYYLKRGFKITP